MLHLRPRLREPGCRRGPAVSWADGRRSPTTDAGRHRSALVRALGGRRHLPLRPHAPSGPTCSPSTPRRRRCRARSTWAPCSATPRPTALARYQRMRGKAVFFPIGWDDNGLATERRVQNFYGVRCDPSQPFDPDFEPPYRGDAPQGPPRGARSPGPTSSTLCHELTATDEAVFEELFRRLGLSYDWTPALHDDQRRQPAHQPGRVPAQPGPRRGLQRRGADGVGRRRPHGRRPGRDRGP